jgi:hypothetical protein
MSFLKVALIAGAASLGAGQASAAYLDYKGSWTGSYSNVGYKVLDPLQTRNGNQPAGAFKMVQTTSGSLGHGISDTFAAFCLDLAGIIKDGDFVVNNTNPFQVARVLSDGIKQRVDDFVDATYSDDVVSTSKKSAAYQLALWEVAYEKETITVGLDPVAGNNFQNYNTAADVLGLAKGYLTTYLNALSGSSITNRYNVNFLDADGNTDILDNQDLITMTVVPLPAAGLLLFGAVGALGLTSRRRKVSAS